MPFAPATVTGPTREVTANAPAWYPGLRLLGVTMGRRTSLVLLLALAGSVLVPAARPAGPEEDAAIERARQAERAAREELDAIELEMIQAYRGVETVYRKLRGPEGDRLRKSLASLVEEEHGSTPRGPGLQKMLSDTLFLRLLTTELLTPPVARLYSRVVAERIARFRTSPAEASAAALKEIFPALSLDDIWDTVFIDLPTVRSWRAAHVKLELARLERMRREEGGPADVDAPPDMVLVPGGKFLFGPHEGWPMDPPSQNAVTEHLPGFYIHRHEVTNEQYAKFLAETKGDPKELIPSSWKGSPPTYPPGRERHPVTNVTYFQAVAFAKHHGWRLPTEREWEKAARGPAQRGDDPVRHEWPWGDRFVASNLVWGGNRASGTAQVLQPPEDLSPCYVTGMAGNVAELTTTLASGQEPRGKPRDTDRIVIRGGSFAAKKQKETRTTWRWVLPGPKASADSVGFRCVVNESVWHRRRK